MSIFEKLRKGWTWWIMPIIPSTEEVEIGELWFEASLGKKLVRTASQQINWMWWHVSIIPATQGAWVGES
jgi:hypothetical protein